MTELNGGCMCGRVRYSAAVDSVFTGVCHCRNCQKLTGTAFSVGVGVPKAALSIQGSLQTFQFQGGSGQVVSLQFCPNCGSPIVSEAAALPGISIIKAGTLDDPSSVSPTMEIFCDEAQPWVGRADGRQRFPARPQ